LGLGLELFHHETTVNAPSTQWWISLSSAIVYGLAFATVLTLVVTPSALMVFTRDARPAGEERPGLFARLFRRGKGKSEEAAEPASASAGAGVALPKAAE